VGLLSKPIFGAQLFRRQEREIYPASSARFVLNRRAKTRKRDDATKRQSWQSGTGEIGRLHNRFVT